MGKRKSAKKADRKLDTQHVSLVAMQLLMGTLVDAASRTLPACMLHPPPLPPAAAARLPSQTKAQLRVHSQLQAGDRSSTTPAPAVRR